MRNLLVTIVFFALALGLAGVRPGLGQAPRAYEPFQPTAEFREAKRIIGLGRWPEGVAKLKEIAAANPRTTLGAYSLLEAAHYVTWTEGVRLCEQVAAEYAGSRYEISARLSIVNLTYDYDRMEEYVAAADQLSQSFGGPPLAAILGGSERRRLVRQVEALPQETRRGLNQVYGELHGALSNQLRRFDQGLQLALFAREAFGTGIGQVEYDLQSLQGLPWSPPVPRLDPQVRIITPRQGQHKGPRPQIKVDITCGDWQRAQADLRRLVWTLDGQDLRPGMRIRSKIDQKLKSGRTFESLRLRSRPANPLARGTHTVRLTVPVEGYSGTGPGRTEITWTFLVSSEHDDPDDCRDDDDD